ncbi:MAG: hypothetical protein RBR77_07290 [Thauera sp.]|jgi:hypothetical protein|nr:hypothetical protein [Thauera sp.]
MILFLLGALVLNGGALAGLYLLRHRIARLPDPGLWWLAVLTLAILLTFESARRLLS